MPLRMKCTTCAKELALDSAFRGASCRCYHCRNLVEVPLNGLAASARVRPLFPPLAAIGATATRAASAAIAVAPPTMPTHVALSPGKAWAIASAAIVVLIAGGITTWHFRSDSIAPTIVATITPPLTNVVQPVEEDPVHAVFDPGHAIRTANPKSSYFGVPLEGTTIGFVVDDDQTMAPYIDRLASITNGLIACAVPQKRRVGVVRPIDPEASMIVEAATPFDDLEGARNALVARLPSGKTDLIRGLAKTQNWYADQLFLVISKQLTAEEISILTQTAEQTGAITHVIALGAAAKQDLAPLAQATRGQYVPVTDEMLEQLAAKYVDLDSNTP